MLFGTHFQPPLLRVAPDFERQLRRACERIVADARGGRATPAAAEWLLENYSFLRGQVREAIESMPRGYLRRLPPGSDRDRPRIYESAQQLIAAGHAELDAETLSGFFDQQQRHNAFMLAELWAIRPMLKLVLLQRLAACVQENRLESPEAEATVRSAIRDLRNLDDINWPELVESLCVIDRVLRDDPDGAYPRMVFETRDRYRRAVEELARHSSSTETEVAGFALEMARQAGAHVGFYLVGDQAPALRRRARIGRSASALVREAVLKIPGLVYLGSALAFTVAILATMNHFVGPLPWWFLALLAIPASHSALALVNRLVSHFLTPRAQVRMDFRGGVPDDCRTLVVVPTLLLSKSSIDRLIGNLEIYYLANRDRNIFFSLLTDLPDSKLPGDTAEEREIIDHCAAGIHDLNRRYTSAGHAPFFLFHRDREWNEAQGKWMGAERKRGKLETLNQFLLNRNAAFPLTVGEVGQLAGARYVITLDSDTQIPRDTAWKLIGNMAHPLNRPVFDERTGIVQSGHGLIQPRIGISMESAAKSHLAAIFSGNTGFDPYTTAVSDVYQDLFGRATFTGKGIYDIAAFERATANRFPSNALLSHDLIEGEHVRAGLMTDLELIDDYPSRYQALSKRKHRWVRGDWQIALWLLPRVPDAQWRWIPNPLPFISRWKIFDNLRRSLVEPCYWLALIGAWLLLEGRSQTAALAAVLILVLPAYAEIVISFLRLPPLRFFRSWVWTRISDFGQSQLEATLTLLFLPAQALLMLDAIFRTLYRRLVSHQNLLEWESMAEAEIAGDAKVELRNLQNPAGWRALFSSWNLPERTLALGVASSAALWLALVVSGVGAHPTAFAFTLAWIASPLAMIWLNRGNRKSELPGSRDFLRDVALATWRYFDENETEAESWLVPDNIQQDPPARATRTSPTNIGLQLDAVIAAHRFGYLTAGQAAGRIARLKPVISGLERFRGHFFNWYDTRSRCTIGQRFVSTVDSGNLAASLVVLSQGCRAILDEPLIDSRAIASLRDHLRRAAEALPASARTVSIVRLLDGLRRQLDAEPDDLFFFEGVLAEVGVLAEDLRREAFAAAARMAPRAPEAARKIEYSVNSLVLHLDGLLADLGELAPWLRQPFESELRMSLNHRHLTALMQRLRSVPKFCELPEVYTAIDAELDRLTACGATVHSATLSTLHELRGTLAGARARVEAIAGDLREHAAWAETLSAEMDFRFLFDARRNLFRIGWNTETNEIADSSYDLLASEARTGIFLAIARGHAPGQAWFHLGRKLTYYRGHRTLVSWSGTMFEYLMPALFMRAWAGTLLGESMQSAVRIHRLYASERRIPWGISESAHSARDGALNYQYRAFGVPACGLDRISPDDLVVAPYASVLSLMIDPRAALENLQYMAGRGWLASYGFYEAIDFRRRAHGHRRAEIIHSFMAHHQGMSFLALANVLFDNAIQKLFHSHPAVLATELLLQERMPAMAEAEPPDEPLPALNGIGGIAAETAAGDADVVNA